MISVIVPVYNTAQYLHKCLESLRQQNYPFFETIVIDDGSQDESPDACDACSAVDSRFKVVHMRHSGIAAARNMGLDMIKGEYVTFVDSDDAVTPDYLERLYNDIVLCGADISVCSWRTVLDGKTPKRTKNLRDGLSVMNKESALNRLLYQKGIDNAMWCKLYKAELFDSLRFPEGKLFEDFALNYRLFSKARRVCYRNARTYHYLERKSGIMRGDFTSEKMDLIDAADEMLDFIKDAFPSQIKAALSRYIRANLHIYRQIPEESPYKDYSKRIEGNIKRYRLDVILDAHAEFRTKAALALTTVNFGFIKRMGGRGYQ